MPILLDSVPVSALAFVTLTLFFVFALPKIRFRQFPGPAPSLFRGNVDLFTSRTLSSPRLLCELARSFGDAFQLFIYHRRVVVCSNPHDVRLILATKNYRKSSSFVCPLRLFLGHDSLMVSDAEDHDRHRQAMKGIFNPGFMDAVSSHVHDEVVMLLSELDSLCGSQALDIDEKLVSLLRGIQGRVVCGKSLRGESGHVLDSIDSCMRVAGELQRFYPFSIWRDALSPFAGFKSSENSALSKQWASAVVAERVRETGCHDRRRDILDALLEVPNICVENQVLTMLSAGIHTTARAFL